MAHSLCLSLQDQWEIRDRPGFCSGRCLFPLGQLLDSFGDIKVKHIDSDFPLTRIIRLAINSLYHGLCKSSISPLRIFKRILFSSGRGKDHCPVFRTGQLMTIPVISGATALAPMVTGSPEGERTSNFTSISLADVSEPSLGERMLTTGGRIFATEISAFFRPDSLLESLIASPSSSVSKIFATTSGL